jgi:hypothetical protein
MNPAIEVINNGGRSVTLGWKCSSYAYPAFPSEMLDDDEEEEYMRLTSTYSVNRSKVEEKRMVTFALAITEFCVKFCQEAARVPVCLISDVNPGMLVEERMSFDGVTHDNLCCNSRSIIGSRVHCGSNSYVILKGFEDITSQQVREICVQFETNQSNFIICVPAMASAFDYDVAVHMMPILSNVANEVIECERGKFVVYYRWKVDQGKTKKIQLFTDLGVTLARVGGVVETQLSGRDFIASLSDGRQVEISGKPIGSDTDLEGSPIIDYIVENIGVVANLIPSTRKMIKGAVYFNTNPCRVIRKYFHRAVLEVYDNLELNSVIEIPYEYMNDLGETIDLVSGFRKIGVARRLVGFMRQFVVISLTGYPVIFNELSKQHYNELFLKISEAGCKRKFSHEFLISKFRELMKILPHRGSISMRDIVPARFGFFFC